MNVTEIHTNFDFERVIDLTKLAKNLENTSFKLADRGSVVWIESHPIKHFSHKFHNKGAFTMKYVHMTMDEATATFRELYPIYVASLGDEMNESDGFRERNPERFEALRAERKEMRKKMRRG